MTLRLVNFKSYADQTIEFGPLTSFIGENEHGKTNIFRALRIICHHENWKERWLRNGTSSGMIELTLDGVTVRRKRGRKTESTEIQRGDHIEVFSGKVDATEKVREALGFHKVILDKPTSPTDLNFIPVFSIPFLIPDPPQTAYKKLTAITGGHELELSKKLLLKQNNVSKTLRDKSVEDIKVLEERESLLQSSLQTLIDLADTASALQQKYDTAKAHKTLVEDLTLEQESLPNEHLLNKVLAAESELVDAYDTYSTHVKTVDLISSLLQANEELNAYEESLASAEANEKAWQERYMEVLKLLGKCPTCGQET